uniref:Uncharacterized protein n=1 Tax=Anguilla anguilla TaxID=7936 RepID=A0A0E9UHI8_ANGAN
MLEAGSEAKFKT